MTVRPTVAAIVPVFNACEFVADTMQSIVGQQPAPDEVILVDDGGTDGSVGIAHAACPTATVLHTAGRIGPAGARNLAVAATTAEWLAFCDHDDLWPTGRMAALLAAADGADWVAGRVALLVEPGHTPDETALRADGTHVPYLVAASLIRRDLWNHLGGMDAIYSSGGEDTDLYLRAREAGAAVRLIDAVTLTYRLHAQSFTASQAANITMATMSALRAATQRRRVARPPQSGAD